ncbi:hypothetical protein [Streptomyces microflavus]|uniref:hypothetical protein n=1 Tax=Streptomyces microflavus TaxID=1919 RepID=UPI0033F9A630
MTSLSLALRHHRETTTRDLAQHITTNPDTHPELLENLNQLWQKQPADHTSDDLAWIAAVTALSPELRTHLRDQAYAARQHAAARCLTYTNATA